MKSLLRHADLYHTGIVVDDLAAAKAEYSALLGVTWGLEAEAEMPVWMPSGVRLMHFEAAYTAEGPHRLEVVRSTPGTLWTVPGAGHAHHIGYWCQDVPATSAALVARGLPVAAKVGVEHEDADAPFVLHQSPTGLYIELVDASFRVQMFGPEG